MAEILAQMPPVLHGPSEKEKKYDRQLRLWAASGQTALESANLLLINAGGGTVGVETLKNLVLPGIGKFTIIDDAVVEDEDLGVNFFLDESCRGKSRAQCCTEMLQELNPEVIGDWYPKQEEVLDLEMALGQNSLFTAVLYTLPLKEDSVELIKAYGKQNKVPLISIHSVGFYSYFQVTLPGTFPIVDTHPDQESTADLRILAPWNELSEFASSMTENMDDLDNFEHGHLPLVAILLHYIEQWKASHGGSAPIAYADKIAFRGLVLDSMRKDNPEGGEENFEEAAAAVMKHVVVPKVPATLQEVFDYGQTDNKHDDSSFWIIADAVKQFYQKHSQLPVAGGLPDMKAQSAVYIKLQNIYKEKARRDALEVLEIVRENSKGSNIDPTEVELFCTNARFIKLINTEQRTVSGLEEIVAGELSNDEVAAIAGPEMPLSLFPIYLALTAQSHGEPNSAEEIEASVCSRVSALRGNERMRQISKELARAAGGELHNVSAVMGGMVAQEIIKIITKQYIPIDNTCIYDAIESRCQVIRL